MSYDSEWCCDGLFKNCGESYARHTNTIYSQVNIHYLAALSIFSLKHRLSKQGTTQHDRTLERRCRGWYVYSRSEGLP